MNHRALMARRSEGLPSRELTPGQSQRRENAMYNAVQDMPLTEDMGRRVLTLKDILHYESYIAGVQPDGKPAPEKQAALVAVMDPLRDAVQKALKQCGWHVASGFDTTAMRSNLHRALKAFADGLLEFGDQQPGAGGEGFKVKDQAAYVTAQQIDTYTGDVMHTLNAVNAKFATPAAVAGRG